MFGLKQIICREKVCGYVEVPSSGVRIRGRSLTESLSYTI